jgi:hypothetical protein
MVEYHAVESEVIDVAPDTRGEELIGARTSADQSAEAVRCPACDGAIKLAGGTGFGMYVLARRPRA